MRILPVALALSAVVHAGVAFGLRLRNHPRPLAIVPAEPAVPPLPAPTPCVADPEPIAVAFIDDTRARAISHVGDAPTQRIAATPSSAHPGTEVAATVAPPHGSSLMAMRHESPSAPPPPQLEGLSPEFVSSFLSKPSHAEPNPIEGERIEEGIETIEHDLHDPEWTRHATPDQLRAAREQLVAGFDARDAHELKRDGDGYKATHQTWVAHVDAAGNVKFEDKPNWQWHGLGASFDATDALMRHEGQDPYASQKRKFLDDTREERFEIGKRYRREQLKHSSRLAYDTLEWIWSSTPNVRERKQAVFELWDDCAESGDADLVEGGRAARAMIVGFIKTHLVGHDAFSPDELAALNAHKTSTASFAPYDQ
jgi:hypothetical protein